MSLHGYSLIAGEPARSGTASFRAISPSTGAKLEPEFYEATPAEVTKAVAAAAAAFAPFRNIQPSSRAALLEAIASEIEQLGDELLTRCEAESGLPMPRLKGERTRTCGQLRLFAQLVREGSWVDARIDPALPDRTPIPRPDLRRTLLPLGPVAVFGASNFPLAFSVAGGDTASALAAGCPVVCKAHPSHPGTCELVATAISRAIAASGLPAGIFSLVHGSGAIGQALVREPAITAVGFTGSHDAGRKLYDTAAARPVPIPVFAEMSSVNPVFLLPAAVAARGPAIAHGLVNSIALGNGQFCTKPGLIFVVRGEATDALLFNIEAAVARTAAAPMLSPGIRSNFQKARAADESIFGVTRLGASTADISGPALAEAPSVARVSGRDFLRSPELANEVFGPFAVFVIAESADELRQCATGLAGQLTATIHADAPDLRAFRDLLYILEQRAGRLVLNGFPTGVEVCPAMNHGGPYPATTDTRYTSVGTAAVLRFVRPVCYQDFPADWLPPALRDDNPLRLLRLIDGQYTRDPFRPTDARPRNS